MVSYFNFNLFFVLHINSNSSEFQGCSVSAASLLYAAAGFVKYALIEEMKQHKQIYLFGVILVYSLCDILLLALR